ncbi:MAG: hypothetical protein LC662_05750 [Rhodothermaceae bacterium]|nr:hypothetical protein [Rhodothermaceae bacterium]
MKKIMLAAVAAFVLISVQNSQAQIGLGAGLAYGYLRWSVETATVSVPGFGTFGGSASGSEIGLNLGIGAMIDLDFAWLYGEAKYTISEFDQLGIAVGLRFAI